MASIREYEESHLAKQQAELQQRVSLGQQARARCALLRGARAGARARARERGGEPIAPLAPHHTHALPTHPHMHPPPNNAHAAGAHPQPD